MKKSRSMRLASALLVCTLLSTCMISGTFAKYTTQDSGHDEARVAKWGVELQVVGDLYGESYKHAIVADNDTALTVQAKEYATMNFDAVQGTKDDNVVAPGTKNENGFTFSLKGQPEVDGKVVTTVEYENIYLKAGTYGVMVKVPTGTVTAENFNQLGTLYVLNGAVYQRAEAANYSEYYTFEDNVTLTEDYYPVEYGMTGGTTNSNTGYDTALKFDTLRIAVDEMEKTFDNINGVIKTQSVEAGKTTKIWTMNFDSNTNLSEMFKIENQSIKWKWDFCQQSSECEDGDSACDYCKADTILGNLKSGNVNVVKASTTVGGTYEVPQPAADVKPNDYNLETSFSIDITVTQVD